MKFSSGWVESQGKPKCLACRRIAKFLSKIRIFGQKFEPRATQKAEPALAEGAEIVEVLVLAVRTKVRYDVVSLSLSPCLEQTW
jgi:hypothetical protein